MIVDPNSHVPIYQQIVEIICSSVAVGVYRPGESLPSVRTMAGEMLVNPNTIQRAYQELERGGLIRTRKGLGAFVTDDGVAPAHLQTEAAIRERFVDGIALGRRTQLGTTRIQAIFRKAMTAEGESSQTKRKSAKPAKDQTGDRS